MHANLLLPRLLKKINIAIWQRHLHDGALRRLFGSELSLLRVGKVHIFERNRTHPYTHLAVGGAALEVAELALDAEHLGLVVDRLVAQLLRNGENGGRSRE